MPVLCTNNAWGELANTITATTPQITLKAGQGERFPIAVDGTSWFYATLIDEQNNLEIVKVTARSSDSLTVERGVDNTERRPYNTGSRVELRPCAALFNDKISKDEFDASNAQLRADFNKTLTETSNTFSKAVDNLKQTMGDDYVTNTALEKKFDARDEKNKETYLSIADAKTTYLPLAGGTLAGPLKIEDDKASGLTMNGGDLTLNKKKVNNQSLGGNITAAGAIKGESVRATSDGRLKMGVTPIEGASEVLAKLKPVGFKWKSSGKASFGFIAQDVQTVLPELVHGSEKQFYSLEYNGFIPFLVAEIQALRKEVEELKRDGRAVK